MNRCAEANNEKFQEKAVKTKLVFNMIKMGSLTIKKYN